jgi:hypothetical protein
MKNIHIIPTEKPSRLFKVSGELKLTRNFDFYNGSEYQNIYITSDEAIFIENWVIANNGLLAKVTTEFTWHFINSKKIILTTDQDLIADGVQEIPDKFLEWFVKNQSCESVETIREQSTGYAGDRQRTFYGKWQIIIPQEEPKQEKDLAYWKENAEEDYMKVPISVLRYITELEERMYNEEEVEKMVRAAYTFGEKEFKYFGAFKEWFEQFKKK